MFRTILKIAKAEFALLFYSPVAWLLLVVFVVQSGLAFTDIILDFAAMQEMGYGRDGITSELFAGIRGVFSQMQGYLYFYIPLLTMGLVSRELSSGSIKLLYSSPITNFQIIIGKYLSVVTFGFVMLSIALVMMLFGWSVVKDFGVAEVLTGFLGIYLLLCAYGAIGIFMSSLTSYQIVAAMGTLIVLMLLSMVGNWGMEIDIVRDVTYWLSINGRVWTFIGGMICSEDVLYFIIVICLFLALTIIRLNAVRQKIPFSVTFGKNLVVILLSCLLGYFTSLPGMKAYYDATETKRNTLTPHSQEIVEKLDGDLTITTYVNALQYPWYTRGRFIKDDERRFEQYTRFKPEMKLEYVYYYDTVPGLWVHKHYPNKTLREQFVEYSKQQELDTNKYITPEELNRIVDLEEEGRGFVRKVKRGSGEETWLRIYNDMTQFPSEREITAAFKRVVMELPVVGFVGGHNERSGVGNRDVDYGMFASERSFRYALLNQGFETEVITLVQPVPATINIIVIADPRQQFTEEENRNLDAYITRGGNLMILGEPRRQELVNPLLARFGFEMIPGVLVQPDTLRQSSDVIGARPTKEVLHLSYDFEGMLKHKLVLASFSVGGLRQITDKGYKVMVLFRTDSVGCWNEMETTDFVNDTVRLNPAIGEEECSYPTVVALARNVGDKEQKVILVSDADCISNFGLTAYYPGLRYSNFPLISGGFFWLSDGEVPIDTRRPASPDNKLYLSKTEAGAVKWVFVLIIPFLIAGGGVFSWLRRKGR